ncbi:MAG: NADH-quinone oxidoreductase subunit J [Candidatus Thorarchaeota archaeon]|nr:NADH-quinone oxidoreductase subunit J [Candidatus Thorarchaeota archaeon]
MQEIELLFEQAEFIAIAAIVIILAYLALEHKDIVYSVFFFGMMASVVAGFFLLLEAPFVAGMQIAVYTGGITALIIFGVLLIPRAQDSSLEIIQTPRMRKIGLALSGSVAILSAFTALLFPWASSFPSDRPDISQSLEGLAQWLWGTHGIYVQIIALIIFTTLVGAMVLVRMEKEEHLDPFTKDFHPPFAELGTAPPPAGVVPEIEAVDAEVEEE